MKKIFTIILVILSFFSCTEKKEIISEIDINKFAKGSYIVPSKYGALNFFLLADNGEVIITNADYLNYVYNKHYQKEYSSYREFLSKVLNEEIKIRKKTFERIPYKSFKINSIVEKEYKQLSFNDFFNKYTVNDMSKENSNYLKIEENTSLDEIRTISYYFYLNGYQIIKGDNFPRYFVYKRDKLMN